MCVATVMEGVGSAKHEEEEGNTPNGFPSED